MTRSPQPQPQPQPPQPQPGTTAEPAVTIPARAVWHDLECGRYEADLALWLELAARYGGPVLDVGAGTGRVAVTLARAGHSVLALDLDGELLAECARRGAGLPLRTVCADARQFTLGEAPFPLIIVPMQTLQLLGGSDGQARFLSCAASQLAPGGVLAAAIAPTDAFEQFEWHDGDPVPLPDIVEQAGRVFVSQPTAVLRDGQRFLLRRRREQVDGTGQLLREYDEIALDVIDLPRLQRAAADVGLRSRALRTISPTLEHIGSEVVIFGA